MTLSSISTTQRRDFVISFIILIVLLTINFFSWQISKIAVSKNIRDQFNDKVYFVRQQIEDRLQKQEEFLKAGTRFFLSSDGVTRNEFMTYFGSVRSEKLYSGTESTLYLEKIAHKDIDVFTKKVREDKSVSQYGYPFFNIQMLSDHDEEHIVVSMIEPFEENKLLFGYCVSGDPVLMSYFNEARDTKKLIITPEVTIMNIKRILYITPIYDPKTLSNSVATRNENLTGFLVGLVKSDSILDGILPANNTDGGLSLAVYEGEISQRDLVKHTAFYEDSNETAALVKKEDLFTRTEVITVGDRKWTVFFTSNPYQQNLDYEKMVPNLFFFSASGLSFLMFLLLSASIQHQVVFDIPDKTTKKS